MYSPASQKLAVGSTVNQYVKSAIVNTNHPKTLFHFLKLKESINYYFLFAANLLIK